MHYSLWFTLVILLVASTAQGQEKVDESQVNREHPKIEFTEFGVKLYGKFRFESEGELFDIIDSDSLVLVSAGAVLTCIRESYTIGYFAGGATIDDGGKPRTIPKVFFILKPSGEITFHAPTPDGNFPGKRLAKVSELGRLYEPKNNNAEQGGAHQPATRSESKFE